MEVNNMSESTKLSYTELAEHLRGPIGKRVRELAIQGATMAAAEQVEYRGERISPLGGRVESIAILAIQDFLDLCFTPEENT